MDGTWTFITEGTGHDQRHFVGEGTLPGRLRLFELIASRMMRRQFAGYDENLRRNIEPLEPIRPQGALMDH